MVKLQKTLMPVMAWALAIVLLALPLTAEAGDDVTAKIGLYDPIGLIVKPGSSAY